MPVSHLTSSVAEMLASALNTVTEGSYSHLTTSEAEMLALLVSEMTGQSYSHLTTSVETLWELLLTQAASDGITFNRSTQSNEEIAAIIANGVTAPGGGGYVAEAVHLDGTAYLSIASLTATDNRYVSFALWVKVLAANYGLLYVADPNDFNAYLDMGASPGANGFRSLAFQIADPNGAPPFAALLQVVSDNGIAPAEVWKCLIGCADANEGIAKLYDGDTDITGGVLPDGTPFESKLNGTLFYALGQDGSGSIGDFSDVRIMPGVNLLTGGDIVEATRRLFIDENGKPVDPAVATAELGTPCILFSGDASTFGTNQGNGGAFTQTGTFTNASTSPSD